jgi:hypothetical protein
MRQRGVPESDAAPDSEGGCGAGTDGESSAGETGICAPHSGQTRSWTQRCSPQAGQLVTRVLSAASFRLMGQASPSGAPGATERRQFQREMKECKGMGRNNQNY